MSSSPLLSCHTIFSDGAVVGDRETDLSPRVRGNRDCVYLLFVRRRSIPACVGEPRAECMAYKVREVYPRVPGRREHPACQHMRDPDGPGQSVFCEIHAPALYAGR